MNTSQQKTASANSPLAATVFFIINILLFPITFIGYVLYVGYLFLFGRMPGVSLTAQGPLSARWTQHIFGVREDEAANRLMTQDEFLVYGPERLAVRFWNKEPLALAPKRPVVAGVPLAGQSQDAGETSRFFVVFRGVRIGSEAVTVSRASGTFTITLSGYAISTTTTFVVAAPRSTTNVVRPSPSGAVMVRIQKVATTMSF